MINNPKIITDLTQLPPLSNPEQIYKRLGVTAEQISEFCQEWKITELALFGSVLRDDFNQESDVDFLYVSSSEAHWGWEVVTLIEQLEKLVGREVDFVSKEGIENSHNWIRRRNILGSAEVIYGT
jgi:hypothetical protein